MTKKKENYGCLTESMKKFLSMPEQERVKNYSKNGISKMYERIRKNIEASFLDAQFAFGYLPKKQKEKIDLVTSYNKFIEYVTQKKLEENIADVPVRTTINQLKAIFSKLKDYPLKDYSKNEFERFIKLLRLIESKSPDYETWDPTSDRSTVASLSTSL